MDGEVVVLRPFPFTFDTDGDGELRPTVGLRQRVPLVDVEDCHAAIAVQFAALLATHHDIKAVEGASGEIKIEGCHPGGYGDSDVVGIDGWWGGLPLRVDHLLCASGEGCGKYRNGQPSEHTIVFHRLILLLSSNTKRCF